MMYEIVYVFLALIGLLIIGVIVNEYRNRVPHGAEGLLARRGRGTTETCKIESERARVSLGDTVVLDITKPHSGKLIWDVAGASKHGVPGIVKTIPGYGMIDIEYADGTILRTSLLCCRVLHAKSE